MPLSVHEQRVDADTTLTPTLPPTPPLPLPLPLAEPTPTPNLNPNPTLNQVAASTNERAARPARRYAFGVEALGHFPGSPAPTPPVSRTAPVQTPPATTAAAAAAAAASAASPTDGGLSFSLFGFNISFNRSGSAAAAAAATPPPFPPTDAVFAPSPPRPASGGDKQRGHSRSPPPSGLKGRTSPLISTPGGPVPASAPRSTASAHGGGYGHRAPGATWGDPFSEGSSEALRRLIATPDPFLALRSRASWSEFQTGLSYAWLVVWRQACGCGDTYCGYTYCGYTYCGDCGYTYCGDCGYTYCGDTYFGYGLQAASHTVAGAAARSAPRLGAARAAAGGAGADATAPATRPP